VHCFEGSEDFGSCAVLYWFCMDGVAIVVVEDEDLRVACAGWDDEASSLIGEDLSCCWVIGVGCKTMVSFFIVWFWCWPIVFVCLLVF